MGGSGDACGTVARRGTAHQACLAKAELALERGGTGLAIASEGSFGPHPAVPLLPVYEAYRAVVRASIAAIRAASPDTQVEVLISDLGGDEAALDRVLEARPDVLNHNIETVPRLYKLARPGGRYARALELLDRSRTIAPDIPTKTGLMVGLGETMDEVIEVLKDLRRVDVKILTVGQYLRPSMANLPMDRYYTPEEFREIKRIALELGFGHVESGPLVRSSYHAHEQADSFAGQR